VQAVEAVGKVNPRAYCSSCAVDISGVAVCVLLARLLSDATTTAQFDPRDPETITFSLFALITMELIAVNQTPESRVTTDTA